MKKQAIKDPNLVLVHRVGDEDEEGDYLKPLEWSLITRLFTYTGPIKTKRNILFVLSIIRSAQQPALLMITAMIIKGPIARGDIHGIFLGVLAYVVLAISTDGVFHFRQRYALEVGETVVNRLRSDVFAKMQAQPMSFFHKMKLGRIISRVTSDVESLRVGIQDVAFVVLINFGFMFFTALFMLYTDWVLFLVVAAMAPILWTVTNHFRMKYSKLTRATQNSFSRVTATLAESVNGIRVTQGFARQEMNAGLFRGLLADHSNYNIALARAAAILSPLLELNSQFFIAILLLFGGWRVFHGAMTLGDLITFVLLAPMFFSPITVLGTQYNQGLVAMAGAERVFCLIDIKPEWQDDPAAVPLPDPRAAGGPPTPADAGPRSLDNRLLSTAGAQVEFRHICFGYDPKRHILHDVNFVAEKGQSIALVGHTGSGKSSIINLAAKFYLPSSGELLIDGREIRSITSHSLHRQMGMVQQQNFLFTGTVLDNIRLSKPEATEAEVKEAARRLDCLDIFESLPEGLLTEVGERGAGLSVGQRQLICFSRALLADPRIMILDEATSSIDALTEYRLQKALVTLLQGRTSFIVAHRLSTIRHADLVLVLDQGRIIERGTHTQLLALGGHYAALYKQFVQMDDAA